MATNQDLSDAAWATWASNVITNHGSSLAILTSTNINSLAYTSTGGLQPGVDCCCRHRLFRWQRAERE
jgi:hypothetical protein